MGMPDQRITKAGNPDKRCTNKLPDTWTCKICSKTYPKSYKKEVHLITHEDEQPHQCNYCGKRFSMKANRNMHEKKCLNSDRNKAYWTPKTKALLIYRYCQYYGEIKSLCRSDVAKMFPADFSHDRIYRRMHDCLNSTVVNFNNLVIGVNRYCHIPDDYDPFKVKFEISKEAAYFYIHPRQVKAAYEKILDKVKRKRKVKISSNSVYKEKKVKKSKKKVQKTKDGPTSDSITPTKYKPVIKMKQKRRDSDSD